MLPGSNPGPVELKTLSPEALHQHRTHLEEMLAAALAEHQKPVPTAMLLERYIRKHGLPAAVARFPDGTIQIIWKE